MKETQLLGIAHGMIGTLKLVPGSVRNFNSREFRDIAVGSGLNDVMKLMTAEKLGTIIACAIDPDKPSAYRQTSVVDVEGVNVFIHWTGKDSQKHLIKMAASVITAAMYDILATKRVLDIEAGDIAHSVSYKTTVAMRAFVGILSFPKPEVSSSLQKAV